MNNIYDTINDIDLGNGETKRINCPAMPWVQDLYCH
jgi:hypothetical protein